MKKIAITTIFLIVIIFNSQGQTLSDAIKNMPESIVWGITKEQKEEILAKTTDSILTLTGNSLYNNYIRKEITDSYIKIQTSDIGNIQIKLLPLINNTNIICVVKTVCKDFCDSSIAFYTIDWIEINDDNLFPKYDISWFIYSNQNEQTDEYKNAISAIDLLPVKLTLSPNSNTIQAELDIKKYLDEKSYNMIQPFLNSTPKALTWDRTSFK